MPRAMIVDDEEGVRRNHRNLLNGRGFDVIEAENGHQASVMLVDEKSIALAIVDIRMPVVDGAAFVDVVKLCSPDTKIVVSSAYPLADQRQLVPDADAYHEKSDGLAALMARIESVLPEGMLRDRRRPMRQAR